jgi:hypothetical protein
MNPLIRDGDPGLELIERGRLRGREALLDVALGDHRPTGLDRPAAEARTGRLPEAEKVLRKPGLPHHHVAVDLVAERTDDRIRVEGPADLLGDRVHEVSELERAPHRLRGSK